MIFRCKILSTAKIAKFFENLGVFSNLLSNNLDEIKNCQFYDYLLPIQVNFKVKEEKIQKNIFLGGFDRVKVE